MTKLYRVAKRSTDVSTGGADSTKAVRFDLEKFETDENEQECAEPIVTNIQERFPGFFELPERCVPFQMNVDNGNSQTSGFPAVLKLFTSPSTPSTSTIDSELKREQENGCSQEGIPMDNKKKTPGKSLFAQHFGKVPRIVDSKENGSKKKPIPKGDDQKQPKEEEDIPAIIKNLELTGVITKNDTRDEQMPRLAVNPVQADLAGKCLRAVVPRVEQQIVRLFDQLKEEGANNEEAKSLDKNEAALMEQARLMLDSIRALYLEQIESQESGRRIWTFAKGMVEPLADPAWTLIPIRRVLDALQQRSNSSIATADDVEIVRLTLLWTVLLWRRRPGLFCSFMQPSGFYCRLGECFLIGPEVFVEDETCKQCLELLIRQFLFEAGTKGRLHFRLNEPIAGLDAFMPFYADLLDRFEEHSLGDPNFAWFLLLGAYFNNFKLDGLLAAQALWAPRRTVVRQMTLGRDNNLEILLHHLQQQEQAETIMEEQSTNDLLLLRQEHQKLLALYVVALRTGTVVTNRQPALYAIVRQELGRFRQAHQQQQDSNGHADDEGVTELVKAIGEVLQGNEDPNPI